MVVDGDAAVRYAVRLRWGNEPVIYSCEGHLKRKFQQRALKDGLSGAEVADLWFHCLVLLARHDLGPADVLHELVRREGVSGHAEKASR